MSDRLPCELVRQGLMESGPAMQDISGRMAAAVEKLRGGDAGTFGQMFVAAIDDLLSFLRFLSLTHVYLGGKQTVMEQFQSNLKEQIEQICAAQQGKDPVLLADLIEYELVPIFAGWDGVKTALLKTVEGSVSND